MAISLSSLERKATPKPPRIVLYGPHGVGKTSFGLDAPSPVFIQTEDGLDALLDSQGREVDRFPLAQSFTDVMDALRSLYNEDHQFGTLVIDSVDWLEPMIWTETCRTHGWESIEQPGYGKGYIEALKSWRDYISGINALRNEKGMAIIQIAHCQIRRFDSPEVDPYDRYEIKIHKRASEIIQEHADCVFFANFKVHTQRAEAGFNQKVTRGVGRGERLIYAEARPAFLAKNRYGLPPSIPLSWASFADALSPKKQAD